MKWNEFIDKLGEARKQDKDRKLGVPTIAMLIFSGVFDSMIEDPSLAKYHEMFNQVKKVKKSKANLPPKKKGEFIGLDEVRTMTQLTIWRNQKSPIIKKIDLEDELTEVLATRGYTRIHKEGTIFTFSRGADPKNNKQGVFGTPKWSEVFKEERLAYFKDKLLLVYGIVSDVKILNYGENKSKEMLNFKIFTGHEFTDELVIWGKRDTGKVSESYKAEITDGCLAAFCVKPSLYKGRPSGMVMSMAGKFVT